MAKVDKNAVIAVLSRRYDEAIKRRAEHGRDADQGEVVALRDAAIELMELPEEEPGRWIKEPHGLFRCSECGRYIGLLMRKVANYCPFCGLPMEREEAGIED